MEVRARVRSGALLGLCLLWLFPQAAWSAEGWRADFDATCAQTNEAMALSVKELSLLIDRCAALEKVLGTEEESVRKVYLKRLQMCRSLYAYVLEYKKNEQPAK